MRWYGIDPCILIRVGDESSIACSINHETMHWVLAKLVSRKAMFQYDAIFNEIDRYHFLIGGSHNMEQYTPKTIWSARQNNPELVVEDLRREFRLNRVQCQKVRYSLLIRGVNKWLLARRRFIALKHEVKQMITEDPSNQALHYILGRMQNIAKMPRWVEWPPSLTRNWRNLEEEIFIQGRHC
jgi:hypothetical protein